LLHFTFFTILQISSPKGVTSVFEETFSSAQELEAALKA
jgi:hypothetical protein